MAIKAKFPNGVSSITVDSLHQWDYGQVLEIESADFVSTLIEVHFSCSGMTDADVRPCSIADGVAIVKIPDSCLEQATNITAWVYEIETDSDGETTRGRTTKSITIPVVGRARPNRTGETVPKPIDFYEELIASVNAAVAALREGTVVVKKAQSAENAITANSATTATSATTANTSQNANNANLATSSETAAKADILQHKSWTGVPSTDANPLTKSGLYLLRFNCSRNETHTAVVYFNPDLIGGNKGSCVFLVEQSFHSGESSIDAIETGYLDANGRLMLTVYEPDVPSEETRAVTYSYIRLMGN